MHEGGYYIRLSVFDRPGAFAAIAGRMAESGISLESIVQRHRTATKTVPGPAAAEVPAPVILITYETTEAAIRKALEAIKADGHVLGEPQMIRIEPLG
jgi:homoserine dehydrogenase